MIDKNYFQCSLSIEQYRGLKNRLNAFIAENFRDQLKLSCCRILPVITLTAEEKKIVRNAVNKRCYEFSAGRRCARKCLEFYGITDFSLIKGEYGEPVWPDGYTGSITHHGNIALSAVTQNYVLKSIGIDLISTDEVLENSSLILDESEMLLINEMHPDINSELLIFSIKEAAIKICSPLLQNFIEFRDLKLQKDFYGKLYVNHPSIEQNINIKWINSNNFIFSLATFK